MKSVCQRVCSIVEDLDKLIINFWTEGLSLLIALKLPNLVQAKFFQYKPDN